MREKKEVVPEIRCNSHDTKWLFALAATVKTLEQVETELQNRFEAIHAIDKLHELQAETRAIAEMLVQTYPREKHRTIQNQLDSVYYRIDVGKPINPKSNTIIDVDVLGVLIKYAYEMNCKICSHPTWCNSRCPLGNAFDRCLPETRGRKESWSDLDVADPER